MLGRKTDMEEPILLDSISILMLVLLAAAGAASVLAVAFSWNIDGKRKLVAGIIMLIIYVLYVVFTFFVYIAFNYDDLILYISVVLLAIAGIGLAVFRCTKEKKHMKWMALLIFLLYCAFVIIITILMRRGTVTKTVNMIPFDHVKKAVTTGEMKSLDGDILNIVLFIPFGFFLSKINDRVFNRAIYAFILGFAASTAIETIQLVFHLGYCDINDVIANSLGAGIGYWISRIGQKKEQKKDGLEIRSNVT